MQAGYVKSKTRSRVAKVAETEPSYQSMSPQQLKREIKELEEQMYKHAEDLEFEEAAFGKEAEIEVGGLQACDTCGGEGAAPGSSRVTCSTCGGQGRVRVSQGFFSVTSSH